MVPGVIVASFFCVQNERAQRLTKTSGRLWSELRNREFWVDFDWVGCLDCSLGKFEVYKLLWKWLFWISDTLGNMIFNIFLKLKVDMPILICIFFTFNWLTLTSEMHFVKFHPVVASCLLSRGKRKYAPLGMRLLWKYIRNYFLVYQLISPFLVYLQNYKEFEAEILDLQSEKYGLSFDIKKYTTSVWALGDENVIGIRAFKRKTFVVW